MSVNPNLYEVSEPEHSLAKLTGVPRLSRIVTQLGNRQVSASASNRLALRCLQCRPQRVKFSIQRGLVNPTGEIVGGPDLSNQSSKPKTGSDPSEYVFEQAVTRWRESLPDQFLDFHVDELYDCCDTIDQLGRDTKLLPKLDAWQRSKPAQVHNRHPCEGMLRCATARQLQAIGKPKEARTAAEQGLQILEESLGPHHHWTLDAMQLLAELHGELQDKKRSGGLAREILARAERACGKDCPVVAHWKATVAVRCFANASPAHVYDRLPESLELIRRKLGPYHPKTLECVGSNAWVLTASGDAEQADKLLDEALQTLQARAQPHSPWIFWLSGVQRKIDASRISTQDLEKQVIEAQVINECADYIQQFWGKSDWRVRMLRN